MDFFVYTFTKTTVWAEYHKIKQDVLLHINQIISRAGAQIAFPTQTLHVSEVATTTGDAPRLSDRRPA